MLLLSWKLEQSPTSTYSIMYKLGALGKILYTISITVGCLWAYMAGPGLISTCLRVCSWGRNPFQKTAPMLGLPLEAKIGTAKTSFRVNCDDCFFLKVFVCSFSFFTIQHAVKCAKDRGWSFCPHLKYDTGSQTVICLIRFICVWINFLLEDGT